MALPTLFYIVIGIIATVVGISIVYLLSKALKILPKPLIIAEKKNQVVLGFLMFIAVFAVNLMWQVMRHTFFAYTSPPPFRQPNIVTVLLFAIFYGIFLLPVITVIKTTRQSFESIGINGKDTKQQIAL